MLPHWVPLTSGRTDSLYVSPLLAFAQLSVSGPLSQSASAYTLYCRGRLPTMLGTCSRFRVGERACRT